jgi:hypothetical protein
MHQACPKQRKEATNAEALQTTAWARVLTQGLKENSNADHEQIDTSTRAETRDTLQVRQPANVGMNSLSEYPQAWPGLDYKEDRQEKYIDPKQEIMSWTQTHRLRTPKQTITRKKQWIRSILMQRNKTQKIGHN